MMNRYPDLKISVNGHACRIGKDRYNQRLALLRAKAVADLLEEKGIDGERMYLWSYGAERPYRYNSKKQLSKDRRVEIIPRR
jgi:outer membrane protein OmpA-like peptidoglycan-associated protein